VSRFSDAALLKGDYSHMAAEFRAGNRAAPKKKDWSKAACDNQAEQTAQEVAKHIFALQQDIDKESEKLNIMHFTAAGPMKVMAVVPGEGDILRLDGILMPDGDPVAQALHASQLSLTFTKVPLNEKEAADDGLEIGFLIFDELRDRKKKRDRKARKLSLSTTRTQKMAPTKRAPAKSRTTKKAN